MKGRCAALRSDGQRGSTFTPSCSSVRRDATPCVDEPDAECQARVDSMLSRRHGSTFREPPKRQLSRISCAPNKVSASLAIKFYFKSTPGDDSRCHTARIDRALAGTVA